MDPTPPQSSNESVDLETAVAAAAAGQAKAGASEAGMDTLVSIIEDSVTLPAKIIQRGNVPVSIIVGIQPPGNGEEHAKAFSSLMGMSAMIRMYKGGGK